MYEPRSTHRHSSIHSFPEVSTPVIRVFEPALCCNTGVCGPDVDQELVDFTADLNALKAQGADIERANLAGDPGAFAENPTVVAFLQAAGSEGPPLTLVDGGTVLTGRHPRRDELERYAGLGHTLEVPMAGGCCGGAGKAEQKASEGCCGGGKAAGQDPTGGCCGGGRTSATTDEPCC